MEICYTNNPYSLFRKYAKLVTYFTRSQLGRDYLGIKEKDIALLLPNGYHIGQDGSCRGVFSSRAIYAPKLYPALARLDTINQYIHGFDTALRALYEELSLVRRTLNLPSVYLTQLVVNPDADPETTTVDGRVGSTGTNQTWATIRAGLDEYAQDNNTFDSPQINAGTTAWNELTRYIALFDTSSIPDTAIIDPTTKFSGYVNTNTDQLAQGVRLVATTPASNTGLVSGDFDQTGTTALATDIDQGSLTTSQYNDWTLNATGIAAVSLTGITKLGLRMTGDADNSEPSHSNGAAALIQINHAEAGSNKPRLTVDYTLPGSEAGGYSFFM